MIEEAIVPPVRLLMTPDPWTGMPSGIKVNINYRYVLVLDTIPNTSIEWRNVLYV